MQYLAQKKRTELTATSTPVERLLWHGTDKDSAENIYKQEFNRSFAGKNGRLVLVISIHS